MRLARSATPILAVLAGVAVAVMGLQVPASAARSVTVHLAPTESDPAGLTGVQVDLSCSNGTEPYGPQPVNSSGDAVFSVSDTSTSCYASVTDTRRPTVYSSVGTDASSAAAITVPVRPTIQCAQRITTSGGYTVGGRVSVDPPRYTKGSQPYSAPSITYRWFRMNSADPTTDLTQLQESASPTYTPTEADDGHQLEASVSTPGQGGQSGGGPLPLCFSGGTTPIARAATPTAGRPAVAGRPRVGSTVQARPGRPPAGTRVAGYQWYKKVVVRRHHHHRVVLVKIRGAKRARYHVRARDRGDLLLVAVTYVRPAYRPTVVFSKATRVR